MIYSPIFAELLQILFIVAHIKNFFIVTVHGPVESGTVALHPHEPWREQDE